MSMTPNQPDLGPSLHRASDADLDALPFGVVEMDAELHVLRYNRTESEKAGLAPDRVIGRHFFREVAPCANNPQVAGRFDGTPMDHVMPYTFAFRLRAVPVTLRLICAPEHGRNWLVVTW